ncbi:hypothetical protein PQG02_32010 (plasmid) [Nostoc sp. UHCC 0926]|uniref:hypothetical protein n=1 Tax=Nostoc sp. UHCC 0926 TaxID=3025190 RepID=UPI00235E2BD3|nr:hypothetical protein [Nostoc sp. UHCC 0926]WDD36028.1 hypothetical protein PQG02_32010 [Nostoc sp. UHCC 0926]
MRQRLQVAFGAMPTVGYDAPASLTLRYRCRPSENQARKSWETAIAFTLSEYFS